MSKLPRPPSSKGVPKSGGIPRPSTSFRPAASSTLSGAPCTSKSAGARGGPKKAAAAKKAAQEPKEQLPAAELDYLLPALSIYKPPVKDTKLIDKMKKDMIRRQAPKGEDLKKIKQILKGMKGEEISVHEFVGLVAPYTGDNGTALRTILATELSGFRKMARKVYDTMTSDVSDVLTNEHIQLTESSTEKHAHYTDKMMRSIDEIHEYCPDFDFERYYTEGDYLDQLFPPVQEPIISEDDRQLQLRQEAYHRLMWLRSEGGRLGEENHRLQARLHELKGRQRQEMKRAAEIEEEHENRRAQLEQTQATLHDQLEDMNKSVERSMVQEEKSTRENVPAIPPGPEPRPPKKPPKLKVRKPENWNVKQAVDIEQKTTSEALIAEASRVSVASSKSTTKIAPTKKIKKKIKIKKREEQTSPFHFSPIKTPPCRPCESKNTSPFHYSPPKTPPEMRQARQASPPRQASPAPGSSRTQTPRLEKVRVQTSSTTHETAPARTLPAPRRGLAPKDTWQGFG